MADIVQRVKYVVDVDTTELDKFKSKIDEVNTAVNALSTTFRNLKTNVDQGLAKALATLNNRVQRTAVVSKNAAGNMGDLTTAINGQMGAVTALSGLFDKLAKDLADVVREAKKVNDELKDLKKEGKGVKSDASGSSWSMSWLRAFAVFQTAKHTVTEVFNAIKEGAQNLDLENILTRQFTGFQASIAKAQSMTAGVVSDAALTRSYALMSSFGIPMDKFAENMELVQKMAIRTGQSADFLSESFARGISRLSPLILDNLGIQVSLGDANAAYANSTGKLVEELTKEEKVAALLQQTLGKLETATKGVDLRTGSQAANVMRLETSWANAVNWVKGAGGSALGAVDEIFESASTSANRFVDDYTTGIDALRTTGDFLNKMGADGSGVLAHARAWESYHAAFKAFANDEDMADLFGDDGIFGTTSNQIQATMDTQQQAFAARLTFMREMRGLMGQNDALGLETMIGDDEAERVGGIFALFHTHMENTVGTFDELRQKFGDVLSQQDLLNLKKKAEADATQRSLHAYQAAVVMSKSTGIPLATALALIYDQQGQNLAAATEEITKQVALTAVQAGANRSILAFYQATLALSRQQSLEAERLFDLKEGATIVELEFNKIQEQRSAIIKELGDLEERLAENAQDEEAAKQLFQKTGDLARVDRLRAEHQMANALDKERLAAYKTATNTKIKEDIKSIEAAKLLIQTLSMLPGAQPLSTEMLASFDTLINRLKGMIKPGGSGGGSRDDTFFAFKKQAKADKPTFYGWTVEDLTEATGAIQDLRDTLSLGGEVEGGFLGTSRFMGTMGPEQVQEMRAHYDSLRQMREDAISRFGVENADVLNLFGDAEQVEMFEKRLLEMEEHFKTLGRIAEPINQAATAIQTLEDGMVGLFDSISGLASGFQVFTEALVANADAYTLTLAAMPAIRSFTKGLTDNLRIQAGVEAAMQGAASWAAFAVGNIPGGIMHATAALMYAGVAGDVIKLPKGKGKNDKVNNSATRETQSKMADVHLHFDGPIPTTEAERGALIVGFQRAYQRQQGM